MVIWQHVAEVRRRLLRCVLVFVLCFAGLMYFSADIFQGLVQPVMVLLLGDRPMILTTMVGPLVTPLQNSFFLALFFLMPYFSWEFWCFISPALFAVEKQWLRWMMMVSVVLFFLGMAFAFFIVLPMLFHFTQQWVPASVEFRPNAQHYCRFVFGLLLSFGVCFQLPVLVVLLNQLGWVTLARLKKSRAMVVLGAAVVGMLLTPPDVISQLILGGVLVLLYELGLWATVGLRCLQHRKK